MILPLLTSVFRFIPAQAGNTLILAASCACSAVYPRTGGEHTKNTLLIYKEILVGRKSTRFIPRCKRAVQVQHI